MTLITMKKLASSALLGALLAAQGWQLIDAPIACAEPELRATAQYLHNAKQSKFSLGAGQSKFDLGTSRDQANTQSAVRMHVDKQNPAIMTIVGGSEADIQKLLAQRYHRVVVPITPYSAPPAPMQQLIGQQQINSQTMMQQVMHQQTIVSQPPPPVNNIQVSAFPIETMNRFMNIFSPQAGPDNPALSAQAKALKPFGQATTIRWDPWYNRIKTAANLHWQAYNNQVATEATAHVTVYANGNLAVSAVDINIWKSANPFDNHFNEATKQAVLETLNNMKGSAILKFPALTRRSEVSFDLIFTTADKSGGRGGVGINVPINDIETYYGL